MKDIFANLYNKVLSFFHQAESKDTEKSKNVACNRLKLVLMQDRTNLSPAIMDRMRHELIDLLSKYLVLDKELLDLNLAQEEEQMALMLSIPVIRAKEESEIEEALRLDDQNTKEELSEEDDDSENEGVNEEAEGENSDENNEVIEENPEECSEEAETSEENDDSEEEEQTSEEQTDNEENK